MSKAMSAPGRRPAASSPRLDWLSVGVGVGVTLAVATPPVVFLRLLVGDRLEGVERNLWVFAVVALFAGFTFGGSRAARRRPDAPLMHAAAAAAVAVCIIAGFTVARRIVGGDGVSTALVVTLVVLAQIGVSLAVLAGYLDSRRARSEPTRRTE